MAEILDRGEDSKTISDYLEHRLKFFRKMIYATETRFRFEYNYKGRGVNLSLNCNNIELEEKIQNKILSVNDDKKVAMFDLDISNISNVYLL